jgi:hypothetical protein
MKSKIIFLLFGALLCIQCPLRGQDTIPKYKSQAGWVSLGGRSTLSLFDNDGKGIGTGGQFRIQLSNRVNTDWFADYISINVNDKVRSEYIHIGWSVLYYVFNNRQHPKIVQPYILAGHCFDYNKKTVLQQPGINKDRWGSAVQAGIGSHFNLTERFDVSLTCQYMIHLTNELEVEDNGATVDIVEHKNSSLEGHLLTTVSLNYKIAKLWKK